MKNKKLDGEKVKDILKALLHESGCSLKLQHKQQHAKNASLSCL
jgi:hypothetical protein